MVTWAAQNAVVTLLLAIVVAIVCRAGRLGPASRHALWLVVLIKLLTPPIVAWPWPVPILSSAGEKVTNVRGEPTTDHPEDHSSVARRAPAETRGDYVVSSEVITLGAASVDLPSPPADTATTESPSLPVRLASLRRRVDWLWCVYIVWMIGAVAMSGLHFARIICMQRRINRAAAPPEWLVREVAETAASLRMRPPRVALASGIPTPLVWAFGRATLLWPCGLAEGVDADSWRGVVVHELAHLRRRDHWTGWLELAAGCLWWFNPVYWYARSQLRENAELACDAWVVRALPDGRRSYAEALLAVCEFDPKSVPPSLPALGVQSGARRAFERRLTMILRERLPVRVSRGALIAVVLLAAVAAPNWYLMAQAPPIVQDDVPQQIAPTSTPPTADAETLLEELPPDTDSLPAGAEPSVRVPDGGTVLFDPLPAESVPIAEGALVSEPTPVPTLPQPHSRSGIGRGFGSTYRRQEGDSLLTTGGPPRLQKEQPTHVVESDSFTLTRTTYRVPQHVAENLKAFLEQNLSWPHLMGVESHEQPVDEGPFAEGDGPRPQETLLVVTASPDAQEVIGSLIGLMLESKPQRSETPVPTLSEPRAATPDRAKTRTPALPSAASRYPSEQASKGTE